MTIPSVKKETTRIALSQVSKSLSFITFKLVNLLLGEKRGTTFLKKLNHLVHSVRELRFTGIALLRFTEERKEDIFLDGTRSRTFR